MIRTHRSKVTQALWADYPSQACIEMGDDDFGQFVSEISELALHDFEQFKQTTEHLAADVKAKLLCYFTTGWNWLENDGKVQKHKKDKGGSHAMANS